MGTLDLVQRRDAAKRQLQALIEAFEQAERSFEPFHDGLPPGKTDADWQAAQRAWINAGNDLAAFVLHHKNRIALREPLALWEQD
jgi:hypothetical protein